VGQQEFVQLQNQLKSEFIVICILTPLSFEPNLSDVENVIFAVIVFPLFVLGI
jgi:hypothetical protein